MIMSGKYKMGGIVILLGLLLIPIIMIPIQLRMISILCQNDLQTIMIPTPELQSESEVFVL